MNLVWSYVRWEREGEEMLWNYSSPGVVCVDTRCWDHDGAGRHTLRSGHWKYHSKHCHTTSIFITKNSSPDPTRARESQKFWTFRLLNEFSSSRILGAFDRNTIIFDLWLYCFKYFWNILFNKIIIDWIDLLNLTQWGGVRWRGSI